ncbi:hypothetical protein A2U01_0057183 [Trifolium medium]|uniref:Uncharacterized protein n=1 Tax=Trifolium medium TaxID=97028 RepID=A0A392RIJ5_9FABA|nr:hypothetical protein [Trifolium medium]
MVLAIGLVLLSDGSLFRCCLLYQMAADLVLLSDGLDLLAADCYYWL